MMLPIQSMLGKLEIFEIYEFFNIPVLFACKNKAGHIYLAVWIAETNEKDVWLYVSLSEYRFQQIRLGKIDLHDAFTQPEDETVLKVSIAKGTASQVEIDTIPIVEMDKSWAPLPNDFLDIPMSLPPVVWEGLDQRNLDIIKVQKNTYKETPAFSDKLNDLPDEKPILVNWPTFSDASLSETKL